MPVNIRGKQYKTVAERVAEFRAHEKYENYAILTDIISAADLVQVKASIANTDGMVIATGFAEEERGSTNINKTSALENCETSAIGRALASFGFGGTEYASADEVANALAQQAESDAKNNAIKYYARHAKAVRKHWESLTAIKIHIANGEIEEAKEAWQEIGADSEEDAQALWIAPSNGGVLTTDERAYLNGSKVEAA